MNLIILEKIKKDFQNSVLSLDKHPAMYKKYKSCPNKQLILFFYDLFRFVWIMYLYTL